MSHEGCGPSCLCHELRGSQRIVRPSELTKVFKCAQCLLSFAAEDNTAGDKWYRRQHMPFCPGDGHYRKAFVQ